jgi:hypothetical protein
VLSRAPLSSHWAAIRADIGGLAVKYVRWLGAYGTLKKDSATWETSQVERQVAAEYLVQGRSLVAKHTETCIGLAVDEHRSVFVRGYEHDAYTIPTTDGRLVPSRKEHDAPKEWGDRSRFEREIQGKRGTWHTEVVFDCPQYVAVVVAAGSPVPARAKAVARQLRLPIWRVKI